MDKIIFGDNQFFGVNHMSEQTAIKQAQRFRTAEDIYKTLEYVNEIGIKSFMFTTHSQIEKVFEKIKDNQNLKILNCIQACLMPISMQMLLLSLVHLN